ncbi:sigma 54-interacting transcriptional regulator [Chitiniphilus eburneus]|uniref:Sigma-54-dependent Fis family transcriptional regulator n=1 Tax=Chitiniphilus eburneus TaxID=2571148 RepID=A0A4U0Q372_9NEIS|nr:sigma-54 dependent transcriptional regulator [Chitiniphilus eburneus]TJZ75496.1 sigma-54-dependent Fis family transcriptional regulator [Chitiniphilus eburneus]
MENLSRFNLIGSSPQFQAALRQVEKMARVDVPVLIVGETGTGKELAARALHYTGARAAGPFVPVNCGALTEALLESELFGHERGAFTDAKHASPGLAAEADGGTLFLDEVDALSLKAQAALLRFLQDGTYRRVGGSQSRQADVRVLVATNAALDQLVETRQFRRDLLYRINVLTLAMPALRQRDGDARELAQTFLRRFCHQYRVQRQFHPDAFDYIARHEWPGNVRELENQVHRAFLLSEDGYLRLGTTAPAAAPIQASGTMPYKTAKARAIAEFEQRYVEGLLRCTEGNISRAAQLAGQDRSAFGKLVRKLDLQGMGRVLPNLVNKS